VTNVLSGPTSPIVNLLNAIAEETKLTEDRSSPAEGAVSAGIADVAGRDIRSSLNVQAQMFIAALDSANVGGEPVRPPGVYVEERFDWLHQLVDRPGGAPSQLDELIGLLNEVYRELNRLSFAGGVGGTAAPEDSALMQFQLAVGRLPGPMQRWATQIASGSSGITADGTRAQINARWQSQVLPFCEEALTNRYPFNRRAQADVAAADFARLFAPDGLIDTFFNENLTRYVDTRSRPWTWRQVNNADLGISQSVLQQFEYAAQIKDAFFPAGAAPQIGFQITPEALDPKAQSVQLQIDGTPVQFGHREQPTPVAINWPGSVGLARIEFAPPASNVENRLQRDGPGPGSGCWTRPRSGAPTWPTATA
jgi:type VI secretion system protein ImpL